MEYDKRDIKIARIRCKLCGVKYTVSNKHDDLDYCEHCLEKKRNYAEYIRTK